MKFSSIFVAFITSFLIYFGISSSRKTTGKVQKLQEVSLPEIKKKKKVIIKKTVRLISDLSDAQLLALDPETTEIIRLATIDEPEETAEWAERLNKDQNSLKVLQTILHYWADQNPRTCWEWTENSPFKKLSLYLTAARAWANNSPLVAAEWVYTEISVNKFRLPVMKSIIQVWAQNTPEEAAEWIIKKNKLFSATTTVVNPSKNVEELYSPLIHTWFKKSPEQLFTWLAEQNPEKTLDLDALFLINQWAEDDPNGLLNWLKEAPDSPFTHQLKSVGIHAIAKQDLELITTALLSEGIDGIKAHLTEASLLVSTTISTSKALAKLELQTDYKLKERVCVMIALDLVGKNDKAIEFVKAAGISSFPALNTFFERWGELKGKDALDWLNNKTAINLVAPYIYSQTLLKWNSEHPLTPIQTAHQENLAFLAKSSNTKGLLPATTFPKEFLALYRKKIVNWPRVTKQLTTLAAQNWANVDYLSCRSYIQLIEDKAFKLQCLKALLSETPETQYVDSLKMIDTYESSSTQKELYSLLAISIAAHSPSKAFLLLKKKDINEARTILNVIDNSIKTKHQELLASLKKIRGEYSQVYIPYFFYKLTEHKPRDAKILLDKSARNQKPSLRAIAAGYLDFHQKRSKKWYLSLKADERQTVEEILNPLPVQ